MSESSGVIFTIGHSDHPPEVLVSLLAQAGIEVVVDVRSQPSSRWVSHANPRDLKGILKSAGIQYLYLGHVLGGRPEGIEQQDAEPARARYEAIRTSRPFQEGLQRLTRGLGKQRVCIMCAEEDPSSCHRNLLVAEGLRRRGIKVLHVRGDGKVQTDEDLRKEKAGVSPSQLELPLLLDHTEYG